MQVRQAQAHDTPAMQAIVERAFAIYIPRMGRRPGPMDFDYGAHVARGHGFVMTEVAAGDVTGFAVLVPAPDHLLVDVLAVAPAHHHRGMGRALLAFAEDHARTLGLGELCLYTNAKMTENLVLYPRLGFVEAGRAATANGFERVHFRKPLTGERGR